MRTLAISTGFILAVAAVAWAGDRNLSPTQYQHKLNGSPYFISNVSTDAGLTRNTCNTPGTKSADAGAGDVVFVVCNTDHKMKPGSCAVTATAHDYPVFANQAVKVTLAESETALAFLPADAGGNGDCDVYKSK